MSPPDQSTRRQFLLATSVTAAAGVTGCIGSGDEPGADDPGENSVGRSENGGGGKDDGGNQSSDGSDGAGDDNDQNGNDRNDSGGGGEVHTISVISDDFDPRITRIAVGDTVRFVCEDGTHTVTLYHPDNGQPRRAPAGVEAFDSGFMSPGDEFEVTFDTAGVYDYFCRPHHSDGMVGSLVVGNNDDPNQAGLSSTANVPNGAAVQIRSLNDQARTILGLGGGGGGNDGGGGGRNGDDDDEEEEEEEVEDDDDEEEEEEEGEEDDDDEEEEEEEDN